jgi:hypothetical protein
MRSSRIRCIWILKTERESCPFLHSGILWGVPTFILFRLVFHGEIISFWHTIESDIALLAISTLEPETILIRRIFISPGKVRLIVYFCVNNRSSRSWTEMLTIALLHEIALLQNSPGQRNYVRQKVDFESIFWISELVIAVSLRPWVTGITYLASWSMRNSDSGFLVSRQFGRIPWRNLYRAFLAYWVSFDPRNLPFGLSPRWGENSQFWDGASAVCAAWMKMQPRGMGWSPDLPSEGFLRPQIGL